MGTYLKGILGPFSGKVGTVVGSTWKGIDYMRSLPKPSSKEATSAQLEQRLKFAMTVGFLKPILALVSYGFRRVAGASSGFNVAVARVLKDAFTGIYPDFQIDYSKVVISEGPLGMPSGVGLAAEAGKVTYNWQDNSSGGFAEATDKAILLVYNPMKGQYHFNLEGAARSAATMTVDLPQFEGDEVHCWIAFQSADGKTISNSVYAGNVELS